MEDLAARVRTLEAKVAELCDRASIQELRFRYHVAVNEKQLESIPLLFAEGAEVEFEGIGSARGIDAIETCSEPSNRMFFGANGASLDQMIFMTIMPSTSAALFARSAILETWR